MFSIWLALIRTSKGLLGNSLHWLKKLERNVFWLRWPCRQPASPALNNQLWSVRLLEASVSLRLMIHTAPPFQRERNKMAAFRARGGAKNPHSKLKIAAEVEWKNTVLRFQIKPLQFRYHVGFFWNCFMIKYLHTWWNVDISKQHVWVMFQSQNQKKKIRNGALLH